MAKKYRIETFGCQMNVHDSERMAGLLDQAGYEPTNDDRDADVIVINTCSVREHAEAKLYTRLGEIRVIGEETGRRPAVVRSRYSPFFPALSDEAGKVRKRRFSRHLLDGQRNRHRLCDVLSAAEDLQAHRQVGAIHVDGR